MRICSFLPSATEILFALGAGDCVVGVTHECDFPPEARTRRLVVRSRLPQGLNAEEIDRRVTESMARGESLYEVDVAALEELRPDWIITQDLCRVCAASVDDLGKALTILSSAPKTLTLNPHTLAEVWQDVRMIGRALGFEKEGERVAQECQKQIEAVKSTVSHTKRRPRVVCLEWLAPPFIAGHWVPEMVAAAGGEDALGEVGKPGVRVHWETVLQAQPEVIVIMPCGYHLEEAVQEYRSMTFPKEWNELPATRDGRVYAVEATSYFSRSGPRLASGVEILAEAIHPELEIASPERALHRLKRR